MFAWKKTLAELFRSTHRCTRRSTRRLDVESLEQRELLAGDVTAFVSRGDLVVLGDNDSNNLTITEVGGTFTLTGIGTTINGMAAAQNFPGVTDDVRIYLRNGEDAVTLDDVDVPDDLLINGGRDANDFRSSTAQTSAAI